jgi:prepilin-type N-terminal cleavage/methylation domain-containing protein
MIIQNGHCNSGFTLIELIIVMAIFAVMSVVALPKFLDFLVTKEKILLCFLPTLPQLQTMHT